jgi:hypothetical protein
MKLAHEPLVDPVVQQEIQNYLNGLDLDTVSLSNWQTHEYLNLFTDWIQCHPFNSVEGLKTFPHRAYCAGSSAGIASFIYRHAWNRVIRFSEAEFVLNKIVCNNIRARWLPLEKEAIGPNDAVIISFPFSGNGNIHPDFSATIEQCNNLKVPVLIDLAYWGISRGLNIDLSQPCITDVVCSLSKPLNVQLRLGIRYTKDFHDDELQSYSDMRIFNRIATQTGVHLLKTFGPGYIISKYQERYDEICSELDITSTHTITLAIGNKDRHTDFSRNGYHRICITDELIQNI